MVGSRWVDGRPGRGSVVGGLVDHFLVSRWSVVGGRWVRGQSVGRSVVGCR